jgi:chromosome partitioning protein
MAQGGGRGWFHRRRHQPEPEQSPGTTHASSLRNEPQEASSYEGSSTPTLTPAPHADSQWSPEFRRVEPVTPPRNEPTTEPSVDEPSVHTAPAAIEPSAHEPNANTAVAASQTDAPTQATADVDTTFASAPAAAPVGPTPLTPAGWDTTDAPASSDWAQGADQTPAPDEVAAAPQREQLLPHHAVTASIDWDAATAAALSDEPEEQSEAHTPPHLSSSSADRLLEDIIREIVGDAAVDTLSSLQPPRATTNTVDTTPSALAAGEAAPPSDVPPPAPSEVPASSASNDEVHVVDELNGANGQLHMPTDAGTGPDPITVGAAAQFTTDSSGSATSEPTEVISAPGTEAPIESVANDDVQQRIDAASALPSNVVVSPRIEPTVAPSTTPAVSRETAAQPYGLPVSRETDTEYGGTPLADQLADETRRRLALAEAVLPLPDHTRIMTISNQKGGVGKTTTAVNLSAALARAGAHVLVIDLDPQGNASTALGVDHRSEEQSVYEVLVSDLPLTDVIRPSTEHEHLDCVPATIHLAGAEIELVSLVAREQRLRRALDAHLATMERPYDYVFIDCPPSLGLLTINAFVAAREVLIPIQCEYYALEGLSQLLSNIELIEKHLNPDLRLSTILLTMYDSRTNLAQQVAQEVRDHFPVQTLETIIPRSVRVSEAPSYGQSVISYDFASSGSLSYREAAAEIARRSASDSKETTDGN